MAQAAIIMRPTRRLSESSDEEPDSGQVDDWGEGVTEEVAVSISDGHMQSLCAESLTEPSRESEMQRRSRSPDRGEGGERSKDRSSSGSHLMPASRQSESSSPSKSRRGSCSPSQQGSRSRSRSSPKQPRRSISRSSSSSGSGSSSGSSSSSSSDDSRMQSSASQSSVRSQGSGRRKVLLKSSERHRADQQVQEEFVKQQGMSPGNHEEQGLLVENEEGLVSSCRSPQEQGASPEHKDAQEQVIEGQTVALHHEETGCQGGEENGHQVKEQILPQGQGSGGTVDNNNSDVSVNNNCGGGDSDKDSEDRKSISPEAKLTFGKLSTHEDQDLARVDTKFHGKSKRRKAEVEDGEVEEGITWRDEFDDYLDDNLIGDEEDRKRMDALTEKEREEEIFRRSERREEMKKRFEISQKLREQHLRLGGGQVFNKSGGESPLNQSPGERRKKEKDDKKYTALSALKARREEREERDKNRREQNPAKGFKKKTMTVSEIYSSSSEGEGERRRSSSSSSSSSSSYHSSSSGESDTERHSSKKVVRKTQVLESIHDLERIRVSRHKLEKFVHLPCFRKTVVGCFVRIGIGNNPERNSPVYRVAEVVDVCETAKVYDVMKGKSRTNVGLKLKFGKDSRVFRLQYVSNAHFEENEFVKWKETCAAQDVPLPTLSQVEEKAKAIEYAVNYRFSSADVDKVIASKGRFSKEPKNFAMQKTHLNRERGIALECGNQDRANELEDELKELEFRAEELGRGREGNLAMVQQINSRNRRDNLARAEKSIVAEAEALALKGPGVLDPFTRRKTVPVMHQGVMQVKREKCKVLGEEDISLPDGDQASAVKGDKAGKSGDSSSGDIFSAHAFDLDIKLGQVEQRLVVRPTNSVAGPAKKRLKIEDYKKRKGIL